MPTRLVSPELGALLREFREPTRIVDAVLRFSRAHARDPFDNLDDAFDALIVFINARLLVSPDSSSAAALVATLAPGQEVASYEVRRLVSSLEDNEVYLAQTPEGRSVALKLARPGAPQIVAAGLAAEARILSHLGGGSSPALVEHGIFRGRSFLAQEWRPGVPISVAAQKARVAGDRQSLHQLCIDTAAAYACLHRRDVVHGDVHPGNVVVDEDGRVAILDYGRSRLVTLAASGPPDVLRAGIPYFYEPELATALRDGLPLPAATFLGEQYSLAALLYYLVTGIHYLDFSTEHAVLLTQVVESPPLPFAARGLDSWPALEEVLVTALAKDSLARFSSVASFRDVLAKAESTPRRVVWWQSEPADRARQLVERAIGRVRVNKEDALTPGNALDLAWFGYRAALVREDHDLLAGADVWASRAARDGAPTWAHAAVSAEIHRARGDLPEHDRSLRAFVAACEQPPVRFDLLGGRAGALAIAAHLLHGIDPGIDREPLARWTRRTVEGLWRTIDAWPAIADCREMPHLGMAHGWAGLLYATLRACRSTLSPVPGGLDARLQQLAELHRPTGRGAHWPGTIAHSGGLAKTPSWAPGWCSGSAGHVLLWTLAHKELGDTAFLSLARLAGAHAADYPAASPDLCCGTTGRALALLHLYQATGEIAWLWESQRLAQSSAAAWSDPTDGLSLRNGPLGTALLLIELEAPERAVLPVPWR
jgi:serine/threonine-protein kinase